MAEVQHRPTILMVGQGEPMQTELGEVLDIVHNVVAPDYALAYEHYFPGKLKL